VFLLNSVPQVSVFVTTPVDTVVLVDGGETLRNWDKGSPIELRRTQEEFPWWSVQVELPMGEQLEFKFTIRRTSGNWIWEPFES
jgi:hypothetical protein